MHAFPGCLSLLPTTGSLRRHSVCDARDNGDAYDAHGTRDARNASDAYNRMT
jgi:hypothetical protein